MEPKRKIERRLENSRAFQLVQPLFMQIPKQLASVILAGCALIAIFTSQVASTVAFGPFFLLICAFGAWFVGNRFALSLGLFIALIQTLSGHAVALADAPIVLALQLTSALAVVLMLGVARAALEIEWRFARVDPLTGALNRKAFFEAAEDSRGQRNMTVLIFADVDGLKRLNDRLGHEAGDEALKSFAARVRKAIRRDDVFARLGGDEFVIFLQVRNTAAAELVAKRLNKVLNRDTCEPGIDLKCSLGVLILPGGSTSIDNELKQADTLMYHAKREGVGLMMAISVRGDLQQLLPPPPASNSAMQQRAAVRSTERSDELEVSNGSYQTFAAVK